jgi:hypothetical protein
MSKRVQQLLLAAAMASSVFALHATSGTYLTVIPGESEMRSLVSARPLGDDADNDDVPTSEVALRLVYSRSWDSANLGAYFTGIADTNNVATASATPGTADVNQSYIMHDATLSGGVGTAAASAVTLLPMSTRFALSLSYCQDLKSVLEGSWFHLGVSLARVKNDLRATIAAGAKGNENGTLDQFFNGTAAIATTGAAGLANGQIVASAASTDTAATGPEEIDVKLGYNFVRNESGTFGAFVSGIAGLGTQPKLVNLFESVVGHRNFGLGLGVVGTVGLSSTDDYQIQLKLDASGHYMFQRQDLRLGQFVTAPTGATNINWMHYYLANNAANTAAPIAPAANALTQLVNVAPRYHADFGAQFVYTGDCVSADLGYQLHYQACEQNTLATAWNDANVVLYGTNATFAPGAYGALAVKAANLSWSEASQLLHTIHGGVLYTCKDMDNPVDLGLGASISLANDRKRSEQHWSVFAKLGVSF